jgi:hypothetical protein
MGFIKPPGHSAEDVSRVILKELENINIDKTPDKLIAKSYDGAAVMSGQNNGVQAKIRSVYKRAIFTHCYAHQLNLILERAAHQNKQVKVFFADIDGFSSFFSRSSKRTQILDSIVGKRLPRGSNVRWNFSSRVVTTVFKYKEELTECLNYIIENEDDKKTVRQSTGLINYLKDADFNFWLHFFNKILPHSDILYSQLQQRQLDSMKVQKYISDFQNAIQKVRSEVDYDYYQNDNDDAAIQPAKRQRYLDNNRQMAREICDVIITNILDRFSVNDYLEACLLFETQLFQDYVVNFPENYFTLTVKRFNLEPAALKQELSTLYLTLGRTC